MHIWEISGKATKKWEITGKETEKWEYKGEMRNIWEISDKKCEKFLGYNQGISKKLPEQSCNMTS